MFDQQAANAEWDRDFSGAFMSKFRRYTTAWEADVARRMFLAGCTVTQAITALSV